LDAFFNKKGLSDLDAGKAVKIVNEKGLVELPIGGRLFVVSDLFYSLLMSHQTVALEWLLD